MAFGGQILRSNGTYWLSPDYTPLNMVKRTDVSYTATGNVQYYDTGVATSRPCIVFLKINTNGDGANCGGYLIQRNGTWQYQINGTPTAISVRWYVFSNYVSTPQAYDIAYYNASSVATWNGSSRPLQVFQATASKTIATSGGTVVNVGESCAVTPHYSGDAVNLYIPGTPEYYLIGEYLYKANGNIISVDLNDNIESSTGAEYTGFYVGSCFYIKTKLYDY
jgi:hypothetical protein